MDVAPRLAVLREAQGIWSKPEPREDGTGRLQSAGIAQTRRLTVPLPGSAGKEARLRVRGVLRTQPRSALFRTLLKEAGGRGAGRVERAMGPGLRPDSAAGNVGDLNKSLKQLCLSFLIYKSPCLRRSM